MHTTVSECSFSVRPRILNFAYPPPPRLQSRLCTTEPSTTLDVTEKPQWLALFEFTPEGQALGLFLRSP